jgi:hypothetical protein
VSPSSRIDVMGDKLFILHTHTHAVNSWSPVFLSGSRPVGEKWVRQLVLLNLEKSRLLRSVNCCFLGF